MADLTADLTPSLTTDAAAMAATHATSFDRPWSEIEFEELLASGAFAVAEPGGFIMVRVAADETEVLSIAIGPNARRRGLASGLLEQACHRAASMGSVRIFLEVAAANLPARNLYGKYGFREVGLRKAYYEDGDDALVLAAPLPLAMGNPEKTL